MGFHLRGEFLHAHVVLGGRGLEGAALGLSDVDAVLLEFLDGNAMSQG
jgi:hypothetical protein